jgi:hypothetical protein
VLLSEEKCYPTTLTSILSLKGRGSKKFLLPWREKVRMRGTIKIQFLNKANDEF